MATPNERSAGYKYKFVDTPHDRYICKICRHPCRDANLSRCCGQNFCKSCLDIGKDLNKPSTGLFSFWHFNKKTAATCPSCQNNELDTFPNVQADREIRSLHVMCTNKERGCEWQGELNDINSHLGNSDSCQFADVKCSNECGKVLQRQYLTDHVETECPYRKVDCQYCHTTGKHQFIEGEHKEQCPKLPLPCPNKCEIGSVPHEEMEAHRKECPFEIVKCSITCGKMLQRQYLTSHVETECPCRKADCQYCHVTGEHHFIDGEHKKQCPKLPLPCPNNCEVESVLREDMEAHRKECLLEMVQCEFHNVGCEEKIMRKDLMIHNSKKACGHLAMTKNQLEDVQTRFANLEAVISIAAVHNVIKNTVKQWSFQLAMIAKSNTILMPVTIKVPGFVNLCKPKRAWYSEYYYTYDKGYKMCLRVDAAGVGDGKGTHLSVFLHLMKGPYDDELTWPLRGTFEVKLLNQISNCEHYSLSWAYDDYTDATASGRVKDAVNARGWGKSQFISNENLHKITPICQYLKDDCIFLQVSKHGYILELQ